MGRAASRGFHSGLLRVVSALPVAHLQEAFSALDCTSFVVMREFGLTDVLTSDRHFRVMGFNPLLADS